MRTLSSVIIGLAACLALAACATPAPRVYHNPILYADYSDPDVTRVGDSYYLVASTFHFSPGIPVLQSRDLVHWSIISHVLPKLDFDPSYNLPGRALDLTDATERYRFNAKMGHRYSAGVWAPAIRFHNNRFYVYFPTPTEGIFMSTAAKAEGPWGPPVKVIAQPGLEDPCPFWDDDGKAYLVHSKLGAGPLILHRMSPDGKSVLDEGKTIVNEPELLPTLEGPKFIKRNGYYYIFAPYGGVGEGPQAVLRSRDIWGPYEFRTVLSKGNTEVQAPHQGGYVETPNGEGWFLHFNHTGAYGRIVHLQPVRWENDWPVMGDNGHPVMSHAMPNVGKVFPAVFPQTSDEFATSQLGLQWEWNHNPVDANWSLTEHPGFLRLKALPAADLVSARNTLTQVQQARESETTARVSIEKMVDGQRAGLAMFGRQPSWIGVTQSAGERRVTFAVAGVETAGPVIQQDTLQLRMHVADEAVDYSYSLDDGATFQSFGSKAKLYFSWWKGARPALFTFNAQADAIPGGQVDIDWLRVRTSSP